MEKEEAIMNVNSRNIWTCAMEQNQGGCIKQSAHSAQLLVIQACSHKDITLCTTLLALIIPYLDVLVLEAKQILHITYNSTHTT